MVDTDVIVVGAGPAGSIAAEKLAAAGVRTILFEKSDVPGKDNVCAGMIPMRCVTRYEVDPSLFEKVVNKGFQFFDFADPVEFEHPEGDGYAMVLRDRFDRFLSDRAVSRGAELRTRIRVRNISVIQKGQVEVLCKKDNGQEQTVRSSAVVVADGPHTLSSRIFPGLGFSKVPKNLSFAFSCDVEANGNLMEHYEAYFSRRIADWGYGWIFPKKDMLNFGLVCRVPEYATDKSILKRRLDYLWHEHPRASAILKNRRLIRKRGAMIPQKIASNVVQDSVLVAGDAAGAADALAGGGIENAMVSGELAAVVLQEALRQDRLDASFLANYARQWKASPYYKELVSVERFRDWGIRLDRIFPGTSNRLKYWLARSVTTAKKKNEIPPVEETV